jgi:uncharacterized protein
VFNPKISYFWQIFKRFSEPLTMNFEKAKELVLPKLKKGLKPTLYYHNYQHTLDVCESVERLAEMENINGDERVMLQTAALFHDTGFLWEYVDNEKIACDFAKETLSDLEYSKNQIDVICQMILSTQIPQHPSNILDKILCDADLDYIGRSDFFITALRLHREWSENSKKKITFKEWYLKQQAFIIEHEYFTESARKIRNEKKKHNLSQVKELLNLLESTDRGDFGNFNSP